MALTADGTRAVSASEDKTLRVWSLADGRCERVLKGHGGSVSCVAANANGTLAVSGSRDGSLRAWDLATSVVLAERVIDMPLSCCAIRHDGQTVVAGDHVRRVHILRVRDLPLRE